MDVSGRKQIDMLGSIAAGSSEDFENQCEPCLSAGQYEEARGFCVHCQEYLCKTCEDCHKKTKASRNHQILGRDELSKVQTVQKSYNECTDQCPQHQKEIIKYYCPAHSALGCSDCMTLGHRTCKLDYIPEKCAGIYEDKEYNDIMMKLGEKLKEAEGISNKAETTKRDINDIHKEAIQKINEFRADIDERLDQMQKDFLNRAKRIKSNTEEIAQDVIDTCGNIISDMKNLQSRQRANKTNDQNGQLFIGIKRAESALKSNQINKANEIISSTIINYSFRRNADIENILSNEILFGELISDPCPESTKKRNSKDQLTIKYDIKIKTKSDKKDCNITGCAVLPSNKFVLADNSNKKVKVVSVENRAVQVEKTLDSRPFDIAVISENQFAVTMPDGRKIDVMKTGDKLSCVHNAKVKGKCYGIDFHQDRLYAACLDPSSIVIMTTQGNVLNDIPLYSVSSQSIPYIALRKDSELLYISDSGNNSVVSLSLHGNLPVYCGQMNLQGPRGVCFLDNGSLIVCCLTNRSILQITDDLKEWKAIYQNVHHVKSVCYSACNDEIYVGCIGNIFKVFSTK